MKYFSSLILVIVFVNSSIAQDSCKVKKCEIRHGIQFQIDDFLGLKNFDRYTFSYRYSLSENSGLRIGINTLLRDVDNNFTEIFDTVSISANNMESNIGLKLSIQYLTNIMRYEKFSLIIGAGPFVSYSQNEITNNNPYRNYISESVHNFENTNYGVDLISGIEFKLTKNVILSGEYSLSISSGHSDYNIKRKMYYFEDYHNEIIETKGELDIISIKNNSVKLGIAIYI